MGIHAWIATKKTTSAIFSAARKIAQKFGYHPAARVSYTSSHCCPDAPPTPTAQTASCGRHRSREIIFDTRPLSNPEECALRTVEATLDIYLVHPLLLLRSISFALRQCIVHYLVRKNRVSSGTPVFSLRRHISLFPFLNYPLYNFLA